MKLNRALAAIILLTTPITATAELCYSIIDIGSNKTVFTSKTSPVSMDKWRSLLGDKFHLIISDVQTCNEADLSLVDESLIKGFNNNTIENVKQRKIDARERQNQLDNLYGYDSGKTIYNIRSYDRRMDDITIIGEQEPRTIFPSSREDDGSRVTGGSVFVRGYYRKNGTYVKSHSRRR